METVTMKSERDKLAPIALLQPLIPQGPVDGPRHTPIAREG